MKQKFIEWFTKNNNGCSPAMEGDRSFVREKTQHMFEAYQAGVAEGEARCAALAAENAGLKDAISSHAAGFTVCEACGEENISGNDDVCRALNETPATDAFLAEVRAQGVDMFAAVLRRKGDDAFFDAIAEAQANAADQFADELRKGVQS